MNAHTAHLNEPQALALIDAGRVRTVPVVQESNAIDLVGASPTCAHTCSLLCLLWSPPHVRELAVAVQALQCPVRITALAEGQGAHLRVRASKVSASVGASSVNGSLR